MWMQNPIPILLYLCMTENFVVIQIILKKRKLMQKL